MIDYYWLKSFTEILQLFISVFFIVYLRVKYSRLAIPLMWLTVFFYIKLISDLYGILNYTSWISSILTRPVLSIYRLSMGSVEVGMLTSFVLFVWAAYGKTLSFKQGAPYFTIALILFPVNWMLQFYGQSDLTSVFDLVKLLWIGSTVYLLQRYIKEPQLRILAYSILFWNIIWLGEVVLHQQLHLISESVSWILFIIAELILTLGLSYYLIQVIATPKILRFEKLSDILPASIQTAIASGLHKVLQQEKVHLDPTLTSVKLADKIGIPTSDLTIYLNRILQKNFNQFILDYRIEASKSLLSDPASKKLTIEQIMYESGFNSKSVFNTAFKQKTGITPSAYRKLKMGESK